MRAVLLVGLPGCESGHAPAVDAGHVDVATDAPGPNVSLTVRKGGVPQMDVLVYVGDDDLLDPGRAFHTDATGRVAAFVESRLRCRQESSDSTRRGL